MVEYHKISFKNAFRGFIYSIKTQPNFRIHILLSIISIFGGIFFKISYYEFLIILILITVGFSLEIVNTAIEQTTDAIDTKWRKDIGLAKDISAAAMLSFSIGAFVIATIIFLPKILNLL